MDTEEIKREHPERPLCIDLFCGLGGWSEGFLAEGYECIGFDIEAHDYGTGGYPGKLILRDVRSIHGSELKDATCIVGSSPCQEFSYRAMPWKRAKALPPPYLGIELFNEQFRIQREASEAAGRYIPLIVENVRGAQKWVGRARWNYGSFYLWGDVPALMPPISRRAILKPQEYQRRHGTGSWFAIDMKSARKGITNPSQIDGVKLPGNNGPRLWSDREVKRLGDATKNGGDWLGSGANCSLQRKASSKSKSRKAASAMIAKIPLPLSIHIARVFKGDF